MGGGRNQLMVQKELCPQRDRAVLGLRRRQWGRRKSGGLCLSEHICACGCASLCANAKVGLPYSIFLSAQTENTETTFLGVSRCSCLSAPFLPHISLAFLLSHIWPTISASIFLTKQGFVSNGVFKVG